MDPKKIAEAELKRIRDLADYVSEDLEATKRLMEIRKRVEKA